MVRISSTQRIVGTGMTPLGKFGKTATKLAGEALQASTDTVLEFLISSLDTSMLGAGPIPKDSAVFAQ